VAYNFNPKWAIAAEWYSDLGQFRNFYPATDQYHQIWAVMDHQAKVLHIETGIGFGLTAASDKVTLKLMLSRDLNSKPAKQSDPQTPKAP
jgi:hypothetical protein